MDKEIYGGNSKRAKAFFTNFDKHFDSFKEDISRQIGKSSLDPALTHAISQGFLNGEILTLRRSMSTIWSKAILLTAHTYYEQDEYDKYRDLSKKAKIIASEFSNLMKSISRQYLVFEQNHGGIRSEKFNEFIEEFIQQANIFMPSLLTFSHIELPAQSGSADFERTFFSLFEIWWQSKAEKKEHRGNKVTRNKIAAALWQAAGYNISDAYNEPHEWAASQFNKLSRKKFKD